MLKLVQKLDDGLSELWQELFQKTIPSPARREFIVPILAYKIQEQSLRTSAVRKRASIDKLSHLLKNQGQGSTSCTVIKPGTRLIREWHGQVHVVEVRDQGYDYKGERYATLSEIARHITGTRWSGPMFFGLKKSKRIREESK